MTKSLRNSVFIAIVLLSTLMHWQHFQKELMSIHSWRQTQTQSNIDNFYEEDMNILNPRRNERGDGDGIFRMEFPLMQWLVAVLYKVFGKHLILSRLFMFAMGLLATFGLYRLLIVLFNKPLLALMGAWAFTFSPSFFYYTINPLPDNMSLCCSIWGLTFFFQWIQNKKVSHMWLSGIMMGIATLCKLPFILFYMVPAAYLIRKMFTKEWTRKHFLHGLIMFITALAPLAWYAWVIPQWDGNIIVKGMLDNQTSSSQLTHYMSQTLLSTLPELLLNYGSVLFFLAAFYFLIRQKAYRDKRFVLWLTLSGSVLLYYLFEANAIAITHDYYLFPFYPLLFVLVAYGAYHLYHSGVKWLRNVVVVLLLVLPLTCYLRMEVRWNPEKPGFNKDLLAHKDALRSAVPDDALVICGDDESHYIFLYYIDKKGWAFNEDMTEERMQIMLNKGAEYLYTDSEQLVNDPVYQKYLGECIHQYASIRIYRLLPASP